jgi:hypothetical protein
MFMPEGATPWKSDIPQPLTFTFTKPGGYIYQCTPHNLFGMVSVIIVGSPVNAAAAKKGASDIEKKQLMNLNVQVGGFAFDFFGFFNGSRSNVLNHSVPSSGRTISHCFGLSYFVSIQ